MSSLVSLVRIEVILFVISALVLLHFQVRGYRTHRRTFFATLASSSVLGVASTLMNAAPYFIAMPEEQAVMLFRLSIPLGILATALATWGSVQFFRAFDEKK